MALEQFCAACTYLGERGDTYGKYYCSKRGDVYACDPRCYNFCEAYSRSTSARQNMYDYSKGHQYQSGGCYLTTAMCNILGYDDDNYYLQTLWTFRDTVLKNDPRYIPLLLCYDIYGPMIAAELFKDTDRTEIANTLLTQYITQAINAIEEEKTEIATNIYVAMTHYLAQRYNINTNIITIDHTSINKETLGKGRIRKRTLEEETF